MAVDSHCGGLLWTVANLTQTSVSITRGNAAIHCVETQQCSATIGEGHQESNHCDDNEFGMGQGGDWILFLFLLNRAGNVKERALRRRKKRETNSSKTNSERGRGYTFDWELKKKEKIRQQKFSFQPLSSNETSIHRSAAAHLHLQPPPSHYMLRSRAHVREVGGSTLSGVRNNPFCPSPAEAISLSSRKSAKAAAKGEWAAGVTQPGASEPTHGTPTAGLHERVEIRIVFRSRVDNKPAPPCPIHLVNDGTLREFTSCNLVCTELLHSVVNIKLWQTCITR